ncbi:hypothetical protein EHS25_004335 [Saitozyma podzolica]|uniref:N-acetyltransferase ESCO acetyl-transferase domain-containing protein n=1 Tax=Saitozyma podzolica TaxID=1890683 RepID=A0A427YU53_9TREE|nr:hypothetical protein EHS25_004335 [Saitozyma podzolica]
MYHLFAADRRVQNRRAADVRQVATLPDGVIVVIEHLRLFVLPSGRSGTFSVTSFVIAWSWTVVGSENAAAFFPFAQAGEWVSPRTRRPDEDEDEEDQQAKYHGPGHSLSSQVRRGLYDSILFLLLLILLFSPWFIQNHHPPVRHTTAQPLAPAPAPTPVLTQTHLTHLPLLHTCGECHMSYVRGGEDEPMHSKHHSRVLNDILCMVDTVLSAPALPRTILDNCKVFLLVTASPPLPTTASGQRKRTKLSGVKGGATPRERIVGVVVAQRIRWAMRVLRDSDSEQREGLKIVDTGGGVICDPKPLPTNLGIHRLFTVPSYRGHHLAQGLLEAACKHTIYGLPLSPSSGQVAFSQPTDSGRRMMERWGGGAVRVFVDDESQL